MLIALAFVFALVVQSGFFTWSDVLRGDLDYHRGVAATMQGGAWQGRDVIGPGPSWFGGLYPLVLGWAARLLDVSFDGLVSVVSWFTPLALPAVLWLLGRQVWPDRPLGRGLLVFVGTVGSSLALDPAAEWAGGVLPSSLNIWPLYPRDIAVVLVALALALAMRSDEVRDAALAGVTAAVAVCVHGQVGALAIIVVGAWYAWHGAVRGGTAWRRNALLAVGVGVVGSAWWWAPRLVAWWEHRPLLLANYPGFVPLDVSPQGLLVALGFVGVLAVVGALTVRARAAVLGFLLLWVVAGIPLIVGAQLLGNPNATTARRSLLLLSIPLVVLAAQGALVLADRLDARLVAGVLVVVLSVPSVAEVLHMRDFVARRWSSAAAGTEGERDAVWSEALTRLQDLVRSRGRVSVLAPDQDGALIWSRSGAQPHALTLRGTIKLGLDPASTTGVSFLQRVRETQRAYTGGWDALCRLATARDLPFVVLHTGDGLVAVHDRQPAARHRVAPDRRDSASIRREVAPGVTYRDRNLHEDLLLAEGASIPVGFADPAVRRLVVEGIWPARSPDQPRLELVLPDGRRLEPAVDHVGWTRQATFAVDGIPAGARLVARVPVAVGRIRGSVSAPAGVPAAGGPRARVVPRRTVCAAGESAESAETAEATAGPKPERSAQE